MFFQIDKNTTVKLRSSLLWEYDLEEFDWDAMKNIVIQRVIERGRLEDFQAIIQQYGLDGVKEAIKQIPNLNKKDFAFVCAVFGIEKEELKCYTHKQSHIQH